ncbi:hypothetical protein GLE_5474 [Lysobacter enzymogenes]|uniref:Uncharacterized protein n=1 Tax=Lysobacter enzymogenes TaxID=69 RepID=A0A0S2DR67_LYSEN|nr:hypothetical protein [Lysobacter enzymogenes]ALN60815.1 hypothetical protein GLE_5474 [Lysobacter enzymogenes]QCW24383.1 hypothetical protein FE772_00580 [Lysobacter enzymogenes]
MRAQFVSLARGSAQAIDARYARMSAATMAHEGSAIPLTGCACFYGNARYSARRGSMRGESPSALRASRARCGCLLGSYTPSRGGGEAAAAADDVWCGASVSS